MADTKTTESIATITTTETFTRKVNMAALGVLAATHAVHKVTRQPIVQQTIMKGGGAGLAKVVPIMRESVEVDEETTTQIETRQITSWPDPSRMNGKMNTHIHLATLMKKMTIIHSS